MDRQEWNRLIEIFLGWVFGVITCMLFVLFLEGCVPIALYHLVTHDVAQEAKDSDCLRKADTCEKKKEGL